MAATAAIGGPDQDQTRPDCARCLRSANREHTRTYFMAMVIARRPCRGVVVAAAAAAASRCSGDDLRNRHSLKGKREGGLFTWG